MSGILDQEKRNNSFEKATIDLPTASPAYKHTELGIIPNDWEIKQLGDIAEIDPENLLNNTKPDYTFNYISLENVDNGRLLGFTEEIFQTAPSRARRVLRNQDILMSTVRPNLKSHLLFIEQIPNAICSTGFAVLRTKPQISDSDFLYAHLFGEIVNLQIKNKLAGSNYPAINSNDVKLIKIPFPSKYFEQRAIAEALSDLDGLLVTLDRLIEKKRAIKQAAMQQLLSGKTRLPGFSGEWEKKIIKEIAIANWGNTSITKTSYRESGFQAYSASGPDGYVDWYEHETPAVVLSAIGAQCGKTWLACGKWTPIKNTIWFRGIEGKSNTSFLYWITNDPTIWPNRGQAQPFIALGDVRSLMIPVPPMPEQTAIATVLIDMDNEIRELEKRREKVRLIKQGMMQELLTGRIRLIKPQETEASA